MNIRRAFLPLPVGVMLLASTLAPQPSIAQTVYRCGPDGTQYSQQACPRGRAVDVADPRSKEQVQQGQLGADRAVALAQDLRQQRLEREREVARLGQGPALIGHTATAPFGEPATSAMRRKDSGKKRGKQAGEQARNSSTNPSTHLSTLLSKKPSKKLLQHPRPSA